MGPSGTVGPRLCPADLLPLQKPMSVGPHPCVPCMTTTRRPQGLGSRSEPPPCGSALLVCRRAGKTRKLLCQPLSPRGAWCRSARHAERGAIRYVSGWPTVLGAVRLPRQAWYMHVDVLPARRRRRHREWPTSLSLPPSRQATSRAQGSSPGPPCNRALIRCHARSAHGGM